MVLRLAVVPVVLSEFQKLLVVVVIVVQYSLMELRHLPVQVSE